MRARLGHVVLALITFTLVGTIADLMLHEHYETATQRIPMLVSWSTLLVLVVHWLIQSRWTLGLFLLAMTVTVLAGLTGLWLHIDGNMAFEQEMYPTLSGWSLFRESIQGATPTLAPLVMVFTGSLGFVYYFLPKHLRTKRAKDQ